MKAKIRLAIVDFAHTEGWLAERLLSFVPDQYAIELTEDNPDYILHSCFGRQVLRFKGIRIFFSAENCLPDFNISDYAIGMHRLSFGDRYLRLPAYRLYSTYPSLLCPRDTSAATRADFCTCVVSNPERDTLFEELFNALSSYRPLLSGGRLHNNTGSRIVDKIAFMKKGRFGLAIENSSAPGYITEKITDVFAAQAIPIYWGAPDISQEFNPSAFINLRDYASLEEALAGIHAIDADPHRFSAIATAPVFVDGKEPCALQKEQIARFFSSIFTQKKESAYRRNRIARGKRYERALFCAFFKPHVQMVHLLRDNLRKMRKVKTFDPYQLSLCDTPPEVCRNMVLSKNTSD